MRAAFLITLIFVVATNAKKKNASSCVTLRGRPLWQSLRITERFVPRSKNFTKSAKFFRLRAGKNMRVQFFKLARPKFAQNLRTIRVRMV
jgi:hypothetical protein